MISTRVRSIIKAIIIALITALVLTGCSQPAKQQEPEETPAPFEFNTHIWSCFLDACYSDDYRESFFNLCDALQEGGDTFECASEEVYTFCMDEAVHNQLYPVACMQITGVSPDGSAPYEDGVGHIYYTKSREDFLERQEKFKADIGAIMDAYIRSDYSQFEKCLALYEYMVSNYEYDYDDTLDCSEDGSGCACLKYRRGVCADLAPLYSYLLLQSGVDAIEVSNFGTEDSIGYHAWSLVEIDGKCYHIDPTWGLKPDKSQETFTLDYFMMTDDDRASFGYPADMHEIYILPYFYVNECKEYDFTANDRKYRLQDGSECSRYDTDMNILYYYNYGIDEDEHEFQYE